MNPSIAKDSKILRGGDGESLLVERAEFNGVAVERGFERELDIMEEF